MLLQKKRGKTGQWSRTGDIFLFHSLSQKFRGNKKNGPIPRLNLGLYASWSPNLPQISVLQGQNRPLSSRSCPRCFKKTDSNMKLIVLPMCVASTWGSGHWPATKWWSLMERARFLSLNIMSSCKEKGAVISKPSFPQSRHPSTCHSP